LELKFSLLFDFDANAFSFQNVVRFLWRAYGEANLGSLGPQTIPFDRCARLAFDNTLRVYRLWRGFSLSGRECGGICARIMRSSLDAGSAPLPGDTTLSVAANYLTTRTLSVRDKLALIKATASGIHPHLLNTIFFNNVRTSFGMAYYGRRWNDPDLQAKARAIWSLAMAAPAPQGILPSVFTADPLHPRWVNGTNIFRYTDQYHTPDAAVTGWWMLATDKYLGTDAPFAVRCSALGDFFLRIQRPSGAIPTWVSVRKDGSTAAATALAECAGSAAAGMFLAALAANGGRPEHREGARRIADYIIERVFPSHEWFDTEVFYSCSRKPLGWRDPVTGAPPQGTLCVSWAAELFREMFLSTRLAVYRDYGRAAIDILLLYQQIWDAPFLSVDTRGGFGVMNTDAEWNDARQAGFATMLMEWYPITGEPELFQRGVSALRAAFTLMHAEGEDRGAFSENYGHAGRDAHIQGYVMPDWGAGTACSAAALAQLRWGDLYVDTTRRRAFGINGCQIVSAAFDDDCVSLDVTRLDDSSLLVKCDGNGPAVRDLRINGLSLRRTGVDTWELRGDARQHS
jgi:hypothetical protein